MRNSWKVEEEICIWLKCGYCQSRLSTIKTFSFIYLSIPVCFSIYLSIYLCKLRNSFYQIKSLNLGRSCLRFTLLLIRRGMNLSVLLTPGMRKLTLLKSTCIWNCSTIIFVVQLWHYSVHFVYRILPVLSISSHMHVPISSVAFILIYYIYSEIDMMILRLINR